MGRRLYLEYIAWGRSCWSAPEENEWNHVQQRNTPSIVGLFEPIEGQYPEHAQQYDESLRPINPSARRLGKDLRRAANDILSVIGVVKRTEHVEPERDPQLEKEELRYIPRIEFLTEMSLSLGTQWITGVLLRSLAFPPPPDQSLVQTISQDYALLGPLAFFLGGFPAQFAKVLLQPTMLAHKVWYWAARLIIALVSNMKTRSDVLKISVGLFWILSAGSGLLTFPLWLYMMIQNFGLLPFKAILPIRNLFFGTNRIDLKQLSIPFLCFLYYEIWTTYMQAKLVHPVVDSVIADAFQFVRQNRSKPSPATMRPGLNSAILQQTHNLETLNQPVNAVPNAESAQGSGPHPINNSDAFIIQALQERARPIPDNSNNMYGMPLVFVEATRTDDRSQENIEPVSNNRPPQAIHEQDTIPTTHQHANPPNTTNSFSDPVDEEINHQIRISELETPEGRTVPELNIHLYEPLPTTQPFPATTKTQRTSPLSTLSQQTLSHYATRSIGAILNLPIRCLILPHLARWWIETYGLASPMGASPRVAQLLLPGPGLWTRASLFASASLWRKVLLGMAIREVIMLGVWIAQTQGVVWLGRRKFKWGEKGEKG